MSKPKIAIIGANESINYLILKARDKGYETHVFAWQCGDIGEKTADVFYPISIYEKEQILDVCRRIGICGVASITSDFAVNTVNYVARNLGLICNSETTDRVARNKYLMRCAFRDNGLYVPNFAEVGEDFELFQIKGFKFPLIVKPIDRWSSKGITRIDSEAVLENAVNYAISESLSGKAIVEEFMDGPEYSCECLCYHGEYKVIAFTKKNTTGYPNYIERGHVQPSDIPKVKQEYIKNIIFNALSVLDIKNGAAHAEFRILKDGQVGIIEIGARMGGDFIGTDLVRLSTGYDYVGMVVDIACGKPPDFSHFETERRAEVRFILNSDDMEILEKTKKEQADCIHYISDIEPVGSHEVVDSSTRLGYYILCN